MLTYGTWIFRIRSPETCRPYAATRPKRPLARKLGISQATLARLGSGTQNTAIKTLQQICKALRCDVGELFKK